MTTAPVYWDPYDFEITADPYPVFRRLRDEAPLYYNEKHDFHALSRFDDVERALIDHETYISGRGAILELIQAGVPTPRGLFLFEDPPVHTVHRGLLKRAFTPKKMRALEPRIREFCARCLDPLVGAKGFDFVNDLSAHMPMRVIGMLLGIPEDDLQKIRKRTDAKLRTKPGQPMQYKEGSLLGSGFEEYVDWRMENPSDDLMTELMNAEFEDENGEKQRLTREQILIFFQVLAGAGNETTNRLIGWIGKVLSDHPDQRRQLARDPSLVPNAVEEVLRYEGPTLFLGRCVSRDVEIHGEKVRGGSVMLLLTGSGNRDERFFPDADRFDIHRKIDHHLGFGYGIHFCLGAALARLEARIALEEVLKRFPDWEVDTDRAELSPTSTVRGWQKLPVSIP
jgi:cytochrome P450